jgi:hypothetical protein
MKKIRVTKTFSLSQDNIDELQKVKNQSALIDGLLSDFFQHKSVEDRLREMSIEELEKRAKIQKEAEELKERLKQIENEFKD